MCLYIQVSGSYLCPVCNCPMCSLECAQGSVHQLVRYHYELCSTKDDDELYNIVGMSVCCLKKCKVYNQIIWHAKLFLHQYYNFKVRVVLPFSLSFSPECPMPHVMLLAQTISEQGASIRVIYILKIAYFSPLAPCSECVCAHFTQLQNAAHKVLRPANLQQNNQLDRPCGCKKLRDLISYLIIISRKGMQRKLTPWPPWKWT